MFGIQLVTHDRDKRVDNDDGGGLRSSWIYLLNNISRGSWI